MVNVNIVIEGGNGDRIALDHESPYVLTTGLSGFGIPPTEVRIDASAADGGVWRRTRRGVRIVDMPITVIGDSRDDVEYKLRRLSKLVQDTSGPTKIIADYDNGESWTLSGHYVGGAETQFGSDAGEFWCRWVLTIHCPDPYWTRATSESYNVTSGVTGRSLIPNLAEMRLVSSQALGTLVIENTGDVDAYPLWQILGPCDAVSVAAQSGLGFVYNAAIPAGTTIYIDTYLGTVVDHTGANKYANLAASPKLFSIPSGQSSIYVAATNSTSATKVSMFFQPRKEIVH